MCPAWDGCTLTVPFVEVSSGPKSYAEFFCKKTKKTTQNRRLKTLNSISITCYMTVETRLCTHDTFPAQSITIRDF